MITQATNGQRLVFCNHFDCEHKLIIPETRTPAETRREILGNFWFIDLKSPSRAILLGLEDQIANGFSSAEIERLIADPSFPLASDQHYCCLDCAAKDA